MLDEKKKLNNGFKVVTIYGYILSMVIDHGCQKGCPSPLGHH
jgi:hypothetical protein